jgi:hypothetical protein
LGSDFSDYKGKAFEPEEQVRRYVINLIGELLFGRHYSPNSDVTEAFIFCLKNGRPFYTDAKDTRPAMTTQLQIIADFIGSVVDDVERTPEDSWVSKIAKDSGMDRTMVVATCYDAFSYSLSNAFAIDYALFLVGVRPELQVEIAQELKAIDFSITTTSVHKVPLLLKTIKESNRAYAAGGGLLSRLTMTRTVIDGRQIPAGTVTTVNSHLIHHDQYVYKNPGSFDPHRWQGTTLDQITKERVADASFLTYGSGPKQCPANKLATMIQAITLAKIIEVGSISYMLEAPPSVEFGGFGSVVVGPKVQIKIEVK